MNPPAMSACVSLTGAGSLLEAVDAPDDLRHLSAKALGELAEEIRQLLVRSVAANGGHLGSNLGVVELTLALHRVFDSPRDLILWDTGHQAYVHKIVTGRRRRFDTLRQAGGLSGYPSRTESEHDWVENSHGSTILSYAQGLAVAMGLRGEGTRRIVAVVGDGSLTGGMAFEALNNLGHKQSRVLIILNDNGRSYDPTVGGLAGRLAAGLAGGLARMRVSPNDGISPPQVLNPSGFFETLGVRYVGPVDGHDIARLERVLLTAAEHDGPIVVHVLTQKGRGYGPAEFDREKCLHDTAIFDPLTGPPPWVPAGYTQAFGEAILAAAEHDPRVVAITAAMAGPTGLRRFQERWPERFFDVGIAEQHAITAAAGMAMGGLRPVVAIYSTFITRAFDQINLDVGLHRLPVIFCIDRAGVTGDDGPSHHGVLDMALLQQVPGMTIFAPSSVQELRAMFGQALKLDGPVAIRYPKGAARSVPPGEVATGLGARCVQEGRDVCILAVGKLVDAAEAGASLLGRHGVTPTVWDIRVVKPLDGAMLASALRHRLVVTVEDGVRRGGVGSAVEAALAGLVHDRGGAGPTVLTLGLPDAYLPQGGADALLSGLGLDGSGLAATVLTALGADPVVGPA